MARLNRYASENDRIAALDGFRAIAILSVLLYHYTVRWAPPKDPDSHFPAGAMFAGIAPLHYGWLGVELFFVVSGFVILMTLDHCGGIGEFALRRFARLWPALVVAAALTTATIDWLGPPDWVPSVRDFVCSIFLLDEPITSWIFPRGVKWVDGAYWSLAVEVRFYILAAFVYSINSRHYTAIWIGLLLAASAGRAFLHHLHLGAAQQALSYLLFLDYAPYFVVGMSFYEIYANRPNAKVAYGGIAACACLILLDVARKGGASAEGNPYVLALANMAIILAFALFLIDHPAVRVLKHDGIAALGRASYSLYLLHQYAGVAAMAALIRHGMPYFVVLPAMIAGMSAIAVLLYNLVEKPAKTWVGRWGRLLFGAVSNATLSFRPKTRVL